MASFRLKCPSCGREYPLNEPIWSCVCGSPLLIEGHFSFKPLEGVKGMWRYKLSLPLPEGVEPVSLGEGGTPVVKTRINGVNVHFKLEFMNPTGSFKDRGSSLAISNLKAWGVREIVIDSSGNAGASLSAYASAAGIKCRVYTPARAPIGKKTQIKAYGAELVEVEGGREEATRRALRELGKGYYASHLWSPFFPEANTTIAYEFFEEYGAPDAVIAPVGSGGIILGLAWGFQRLYAQGLLDSLPRLYGVQAASNTPVYEAFHGRPPEFREDEVLADGVAVKSPPRLREIVESIKLSRGDVLLVRNDEIVVGVKSLAKLGLFVEPTSATVYPALKRLIETGKLSGGDSVLVPLTGSGLKAIEKISRILQL
ncbi:MAG: pyridoxal-phosphate dependent enzyme [Infirmifilum uzonense]|uniref:pyridoxal-phosphate dependent enzyme n=1 Tax=Infirmifilum uzonense TaxID=1550241 RepID=UPI003C747C97